MSTNLPPADPQCGGNNLGITREYTVWCCRCPVWNQSSANTVKAMSKMSRQVGWVKKEGGWRCPECAEDS